MRPEEEPRGRTGLVLSGRDNNRGLQPVDEEGKCFFAGMAEAEYYLGNVDKVF